MVLPCCEIAGLKNPEWPPSLADPVRSKQQLAADSAAVHTPSTLPSGKPLQLLANQASRTDARWPLRGNLIAVQDSSTYILHGGTLAPKTL